MSWQVSVVRVVDLINVAELMWVVEVVQLVVSFMNIVLDTIAIGVVDESWLVGVALDEGDVSWSVLLLLNERVELVLRV